jgi:hypothetical protein
MKVFVFLVAFAVFVGSLLLMGYAFSVQETWAAPMFFAGIIGVAISLAIPAHLLSRTD